MDNLLWLYGASILFTFLMMISNMRQHSDVTIKDLIMTFILSVIPILNIIVTLHFVGIIDKITLKMDTIIFKMRAK